MVDNILRYPNMKRFQETVEEEFAKFFFAESANLIIVNRHQKEMYRVVYENSEFKMKVYQFDRGIAGYVAYCGQTCYIECVEDDNRFDKEVDNPKGINAAHQIISVPVFCSSDKYDTSLNSLSSLPRAVISVINKKDPNGFTQRDIEKLESLSAILGRCHDAILKVE